jgi:predicted phage terminase large subunit-like protein
LKNLNLEISYHDKQKEIFFESTARYKVIAKGRRFGLTRGFSHFTIEQMLDGLSPILWVDTVYGNIERYIERYFIPLLSKMPRKFWKYRSNRNDLKVVNSVCDFRSADRPENIEGFGYKLIIINEAGIVLKNRNLWNETIRPMILDYKANVLIGGTPKGKRVRGKKEKHLFYEMYERKLPDWQSFNYSSYDNPLLDKAEIEQMEEEISAALRDQEVFGKFVDKQISGIIKRDWWRYYNRNELLTKRILKTIQSWDTAFKDKEGNDYSVCTTWTVATDGYYLNDLWRGRVQFPELKKKSKELYGKFLPNEVLIEDKASGQSLIQELQRETRIPIKPIKVDSDKLARVNAVTPLIENGRVFLPEYDKSMNELIDECEDFPDSEFDDIVDSISQFLNYVKGKRVKLSSEPIIHLGRNEAVTKYSKYRLIK